MKQSLWDLKQEKSGNSKRKDADHEAVPMGFETQLKENGKIYVRKS